MSWGEYLTDVDLDRLKSAEPSNPNTENARDQFDVAKAAAVSIIESGVVGDLSAHGFNVTLAGHGNPDHEPVVGWANDMMGITISQTS